MRPGYASTLMKMQGASLEHATLFLDRKWVPAAGYVALSRVSYMENVRFLGQVERAHFVPAE
eukprot:1640118-Heterocapsa_arctica.AAC.1